jgi:hypothetical protein
LIILSNAQEGAVKNVVPESGKIKHYLSVSLQIPKDFPLYRISSRFNE